ncbi:MAG: ATP-binding cassette domain-containing protein [Bacteroidetes bacterium]|nr:ATP-binding cassette domain-containing protein [Bacteroidota bacterium]MCB0852298.1 ATP-binding cassette domain-containing protein [Bacteroidota bacterium]
MNVLSTQNLHKEYGRITAVNQLNLEIKAGSVFGLLGPNGSGKTTTLGMVLGVTTPTSGQFLWFGEKPSHQQRKRVGSILEKPNFYPNLSGYKNLQVACKIKEVPETRIDKVLDQVGLLERKNDSFKTYSLGMKQRLAIGSALLANPEVLILDEPTNGVDPKGIAEIRELILEIATTGKTIILASHLLDEVQKVCSDFAILSKGNLIHTGRVDAGFDDDIVIEIAARDHEALVKQIGQFPGYITHRPLKDGIEVRCTADTQADTLNKYLTQIDIFPYHLHTIKKTLEQQFLEILTQNNA